MSLGTLIVLSAFASKVVDLFSAIPSNLSRHDAYTGNVDLGFATLFSMDVSLDTQDGLGIILEASQTSGTVIPSAGVSSSYTAL